MKRVVWLTDIHLNFLSAAESRQFLGNVRDARPDVVLIGGDIAEVPDLTQQLALIAEELPYSTYFVLGNHDYYFGSIRQVRADVERICREKKSLVWLPSVDVVELTPTVGLCGHDGWADARLGDYERSLVMMNDYRLIEELAGANKADRWPLLKALGDAAAEHVRRVLPWRSIATRGWCFSPTCRRCARPAGIRGRFPTTSGCPTSPAWPSARRCSRSCASGPNAS